MRLLTLSLLIPLCVLAFLASLCVAAQLPARRRPHRAIPVPVPVPARRRLRAPAPAGSLVSLADDKRAIASRLLRKAASHRQRSLHDVLSRNDNTPSSASVRRRDEDNSEHHDVDKKRGQLQRAAARAAFDRVSQRLYAATADKNDTDAYFRFNSVSMHVDSSKSTRDVTKTKAETETKSQGESTAYGGTDRRQSSMKTSSPSERQLLRDNVDALLRTQSPSRATAALRVVEELCHSMYNGEALQQIGGFAPLLLALGSRHRGVRASASWAVATCSQNNRPVQRALLHAGAVPVLARLAWRDVLTVRARALFALNALLGLEEARVEFEHLPYATHVVLSSLKDTRDYRATRRALNLVELLVRKNLDSWKTQLEAWDVPQIVEQLLRQHPDIDVRESAAWIIAALDGNTVV